MMINAGAFSKLFDMLEQVFKTMREMVSGRNMTPALATHSDKTPKHTPDMTTLLKVKADPAQLTAVKSDTTTLLKGKADPAQLTAVTSDTTTQLKAKADPGKLPQAAPAMMTQLKAKAEPAQLTAVTSDATTQLKAKAEPATLPGTTPDLATQLKVKVEPGTTPRATSDTTNQLTVKVDKGTLQSVPVPHVNVSNDSNAQVKVELNIGKCHCPDTHVERDGGGVNPLSVPTPGVTPQPDAKVPPIRPEVRLNAHPLHRLDVTPRHDTKLPDTKLSDTKLSDAKLSDSKAPDAKVTPPSKAKSSGIHPGALHRLESTPLPGTTPRPDTKTVTSTDNRQKDIPDQSKPEADVTSPGPAENETDFKGWAFINRRRLGN